MLFPSEYEIIQVKEEQVRDYVRQAKTDRLIQLVCPRREGFISQSLRKITQSAGHFLQGIAGPMRALGSRTNLAHRTNATR